MQVPFPRVQAAEIQPPENAGEAYNGADERMGDPRHIEG